jgi:hypothetical protein
MKSAAAARCPDHEPLAPARATQDHGGDRASPHASAAAGAGQQQGQHADICRMVTRGGQVEQDTSGGRSRLRASSRGPQQQHDAEG